MPPTPDLDTGSKKTLLAQGIELVRFLARSGHGLGVTEIASGMGLPKSSAFRLLGVLMDLGFVQKNATSQRYTISPEIFRFVYELAHEFGPNQQVADFMNEKAAKLNCAVYLCMLSGRSTYVISAAGPQGGTLALGSAGPIYASSAGKVIVAHLPESDWALYEPTPDDPRLTEHTCLDPVHFRQELKAARESGVAWNVRETELLTASVAVLIHEPLYPPRLAVALRINYKDIAAKDRGWLEEQARTLATQIEKRLGTPSPRRAAKK